MNKLLIAALLLPVTAFAEPSSADIDKQLNAAYKKAFKILGDPLKQSQRTWLKFRDLDCEAQLPNFGTPPFLSDNYQLCLDAHNSTRIKQLENMTHP